ncbi:hypothetical protein OS493_002129 [Desmophyllum pertusum]|uniref:Transporter n=1 Tax=Desmophyllum pertusum TaxID=174260 RepID=A0A9X0CV35_9CNID|nr:hypothetical protein OS493_002129 [Desmophyllum pertusum]
MHCMKSFPVYFTDMTTTTEDNTLEEKPEQPVDKQENPDVQVEEQGRDRWSRKIEFLFACIGFCVGYGNMWRFPYMCFKNGGGAFLIPYLLFLTFGGIPIFFLEQCVGQFTQAEPVHAWNKLCPLLRGIGFASIAVSFLVSVYYNVIMAWSLYYFYQAFKKDIPWVGCHHPWNTPDCYVYNASNQNASGVSPVENTLEEVLRITSGIDEPGPLNGPITISLLVAWILVYFCIWKGVRTTGKVVYVTATAPYFILVILFFRGITLPGAKDGLIFYLVPSWERLGDPKVWIDAAAQVLYSLTMGMGVNLTFASYNNKNNNILKDALIISVTNCATSVFAGFAIFSILGFIAGQQGKSIEDVASQGPGLAFIAYPAALAELPVPQAWAVLFFFMLIMLGLDSQFGQVEIVAACLIEHYPRQLSRYRELVVLVICVLLFLMGLSCVTNGGIYVFNLFDSFSAGLSLLFIVFLELIVVAWIYGADRFSKDVEDMIGYPISKWWLICWKYISPLMVLGILLFSLIKYTRITYEDYVYPPWGEALGWLITVASMLCVPLLVIKTIVDIIGGKMMAETNHGNCTRPYLCQKIPVNAPWN